MLTGVMQGTCFVFSWAMLCPCESLLAELYRVVDTLPPHHLLFVAPRSDAGAVVYACI